MKLFWSSRSPFVRKVMIVAHEIGLADRIECSRTIVSPTKPNADVMSANPLNKIPTLLTDDGVTLYDSRVICEHLDGLHAGTRLFPVSGPARIEALRRQALGDGMMDFLLVWLSERLRPPELQYQLLVDTCRAKLAHTLDAMEAEASALAAAPFTIGHIAIGCALSYADFRYQDEGWRRGHARLAAWHETISSRPSFKATELADIY